MAGPDPRHKEMSEGMTDSMVETRAPKRLWIRNPLAILAEDSAGGIVVEGTRIVERVRAGAAPAAPVDETFEAAPNSMSVLKARSRPASTGTAPR